jgi:hypothetical protein
MSRDAGLIVWGALLGAAITLVAETLIARRRVARIMRAVEQEPSYACCHFLGGTLAGSEIPVQMGRTELVVGLLTVDETHDPPTQTYTQERYTIDTAARIAWLTETEDCDA